jgi:hypothetical protein
MDYTKSEVAVLGEAVRVIEQLQPPKISGRTELTLTENPAYNLDQ